MGQSTEEIIWDNSFINICQKPISWKTWRLAGINRIRDLLHHSLPRFLSHIELGQKYGIAISFLEILQLRSAIPCQWKRKLISPARQEINDKPFFYNVEDDPTPVIGKSSKFVYYTLVKFLKPTITSQVRWNEIFPINDQDQHEYWTSIYKLPYKSARDTKLQAFQFRVIHRFLPCNQFLKNIRITREDKCSFCTDTDSIQHFLFTCTLVQDFWRQLISWFAREADIQLTRAFLFGVPTTLPQASVINFILLFSKFYIYRQELFHQGSLDLVHFLREFRTRLQVEKYLNKLENKPHHFFKWNRTLTALG